ncbi:MAG TPA: Ig-like domain repeat protein [Casimicrobiaceae bacterium]|nr:Ig-like domain repeat protein [Casimicrobiaceae bacterium]
MQLIRPVIAAVVATSMALASQFALAHGPALETVHEPVTVDSVETLSGTVHEIIVDDPTRGASHRYVELQLADGTLVPLRGASTDALAKDARVEVSGRHRGKALEIDASRALSADRQVEPKGITEVDGTLAVLHADYFAEDKSTFIYEVHEASGSVRQLRMGSMPAPLEAGMKVRVHGRVEADNESMTPDRITIVARPTSSNDEKIGGAVAKAATVRSVLVIMANFNNTAVPALTSAQAQQIMTTNGDSVANFFQETSYGQQIMNVTLTGWVTMNLAQPASCGSTDWRNIGTAAEAAAKSLGAAYDPATYAFVVYVFPAVPSCGWLGLAYISSPHKAWINGTGAFRTSTVAHEMGHNFGLLHAASLRCSGVIGGTCSVSEYGDPFDAMGNQRAMHYNAMQKSKLGWIPPSSVKTYTGGSATYTLTPIENAGADTYAVKIPTGATNRTYWLEFRQPIGFDSPLASFPNNGAQIRVAYPFESQCAGCDSYSDDTQIVDTTPGTSAFTDATLVAGQTFTDPDYGINVTVLSASASAMTVQIGAGAAPPPPPPPPPITGTSTSVVASANPSIAGATVTFTATVTGNAPTGAVGFQDNGATISGCASAVLSGSGNARSATCSTNGLFAGAHAITASYAGDAANSASTSGTLGEVVNPPTNGTNVALAANGGVASSSSIHDPGFSADGVNDNRRSGAGWGNGGGWNDGTPWVFQDWVQINFNGQKTIDHVVVYTLQDNYQAPVEPTDGMTFTKYGVTDFQVQAWNGSGWVTLGTVSGNNLVKRTVSFSAYTTDRIRVLVTGSKDGLWSRITEIEAWTSSPVTSPSINYALSPNGGSATSSSVHDPYFTAAATIDGQRSGANWNVGGGWNDGTPWVFQDWVQVNFNGQKTIDHVVLYTLQDNVLNPAEPTDAMTFSLYGITDFQVQGWNGSGWVTLGSVTGNRFVKRVVSFTPYSTDRIRIYVLGSKDGVWSRITEIEAWGN